MVAKNTVGPELPRFLKGDGGRARWFVQLELRPAVVGGSGFITERQTMYVCISLSVTNLASAPDRHCWSNSSACISTASVPAFQPAETFMTCLTHPDFFAFLSTERVDKRNIKAPITTSKCRLTTSEDAWVVFTRYIRHAACLPGQRSQLCKFLWCF